MIEVRMKGDHLRIAAEMPTMQAQKSCQIISVSSVAGHKVRPGGVVHSATKYAVRVISEGLRREVKPYNIRSIIVSLGAADTELPESVADLQAAAAIEAFYDQHAIPANSFARVVAFAVAEPPEVDIKEILFRPTSQEI